MLLFFNVICFLIVPRFSNINNIPPKLFLIVVAFVVLKKLTISYNEKKLKVALGVSPVFFSFELEF